MAQYKAFISYRKPVEKKAIEIKEILESRGYDGRVFLDKSEIASGEVWDKINGALHHSEYFILLISQTSFIGHKHEPDSDIYLREILTAEELGLRIIPIFYADIPDLYSGNEYCRLARRLKANPISGITMEMLQENTLLHCLLDKIQKNDAERMEQWRKRCLGWPFFAVQRTGSFLTKKLRQHPFFSILGLFILAGTTSCIVFPEARDSLRENLTYCKEKISALQQEMRQADARPNGNQGQDEHSEHLSSSATEGADSPTDNRHATESDRRQVSPAKKNPATATSPSASAPQQKQPITTEPTTSRAAAPPIKTINGAKKLRTVNGKAPIKPLQPTKSTQPQNTPKTPSFSDLLDDPFMPH